jgi:glutathione S-transferase
MKLYYSPNLNPRIAVAVAKHLGSPVEFVRASPRHPDHEEAFRPLNPNTLVPVLVEDGRPPLWETDAIACRLSVLARSDFWPLDGRLPELIQWLSWSAHHFTQAGGAFYFENIVKPKILNMAPDEALLSDVAPGFCKLAGILDATLADRVWLVGDRLSYADFRVASILPFAEEAKAPLGGFANIRRWRDRLDELDAWRCALDGLDVAAIPEVAA